MKDSFIIYKSFYEPIKTLSDKQLGRLFRALFCYQIDKSISVDADIQMAFAFFKNQMDIDESKYQEVVSRNRMNGSKGGRPTKVENPKNPVGFEKPKKADNDNVNDNDINKSNSKELLRPTSQPDIEKIDWQHLVIWVNEKINGVYGQIRNPLSEKRKKSIRCRIRDHGKEAFSEAITKAVESDFLRNSTFCNFDWIIKQINFEKIISGNYDNKNKRGNAAQPIDEEFLKGVAEGCARAEYNMEQEQK